MVGSVALTSVPCSVCGSLKGDTVYVSAPMRTGVFEGISNSLYQCADCGFIYTNPRPVAESYQEHYAELDAGSGQVFREMTERGDLSEGSVILAQYVSDLIAQRKPGRLLDVGCGVGSFLNALEGTGWCFEGIEPSPTATCIATEHGRVVHQGFVDTVALEAASYDVVTILNVLEHIWDPNAAISVLSRIASTDALLVVAVPNSLYPIVGGAEFFEIEHVSHFTPYTLKQLLVKHGWTNVHWETKFGVDKGILLMATRTADVWNGLPIHEIKNDLPQACQALADYAELRSELLQNIHDKFAGNLAEWRESGKRIGLYGAGSYAAQMLNLLGDDLIIDRVFDGDARKWGGVFHGLTIQSPQDICDDNVDVFLVASGVFFAEISATIKTHARPGVEIIALSGDAKN
jgi:SAM-dependent methyltransferase